ncbi:bifunctional anthranilate synthase component I family protein/class IV aminotransferase [Streptomyces sp. NPDC056716]|uniref:bifunctional anthranilate synthase component I family protein/class IV aminotransferase n=1 Tax=unclassified Streptomyces TaxID=2593676 RepID=UPI0036A75EF4
MTEGGVRGAGRVVRRALGWSLTMADVLRLIRADAHPVCLSGDWAGGFDVVASEPVAVRTGTGTAEDVLDAPFPVGSSDGSAVGGSFEGGRMCSFGGGWIGYLGYAATGEALPPRPGHRLPTLWFGFYDHVLVRDRVTGEWVFEALWSEERGREIERRFAELVRRAEAVPPARAYTFSPFRLLPGGDEHREAVRGAVEYIHQGDIFQANICLRAEAGFAGDPLDAFCLAADGLRPPYAAFIGVSDPGDTGFSGDTGDTGTAGRSGSAGVRAAVASLSPELFLRREAGAGRAVVAKPVKGTAPRSGDAAEAAAQRAGLLASAKNRAENVMIVDLLRNDLARVCVPGSVTVPVLLGAEPHPGVWHLVSTVEGVLAPGRSDGDLIRATFPPGSVTGAPKVRALEIIDELESTAREVYTGAVGYRSPVAGLELNVAIRTFEFAEGRSWLGAGGGIVADSRPDDEFAEAILKARPLLAAIGATLGTGSIVPDSPGMVAESDAVGSPGMVAESDAVGSPSTVAGPDPFGSQRMTAMRHAVGSAGTTAFPDAATRPRPTAGVRTALRVSDGRARDLTAHLARLSASVLTLYGKRLPASLPGSLREAVARRPTGQLHITVRPKGGPLQVTVEVLPQSGTDTGPPAVRLRPAVVPGGIGEHAYADRRLLALLTARLNGAPDEQVLITDGTGELLETDRANVFAVIDGVLLTPPADGRLLPGVTRAAVLSAARGHGVRTGLASLVLGDLAYATEVFVTDSLTGVTPVAAADGCPVTWQPGPVTAALARALAAMATMPVAHCRAASPSTRPSVTQRT